MSDWIIGVIAVPLLCGWIYATYLAAVQFWREVKK